MVCAQILCARLKILAMPPGRAVVQHGGAAAAEVEPDLAPCILRGGWAPGPEQRKLLPRLRCAHRFPSICNSKKCAMYFQRFKLQTIVNLTFRCNNAVDHVK